MWRRRLQRFRPVRAVRPCFPPWKISRGQQAFETASDDCLGLGHDPVDQFPASRNVVDESRDHPAAPGARIQLAVLQDALISGSADEVANVLDRRGGALLALDSQDFLDG